uniref:Phage tail collar domain-containing protein n=1 Tax=viral metagenome TaxID=1070528 RepID=A0A6C0I5R1_9ZZZZ
MLKSYSKTKDNVKYFIFIVTCVILVVSILSLLDTKGKVTIFKMKNRNEYDKNIKPNKFKTANPGYGKIVSVDDDGNLNTFEFPRGIIVAWSGEITKIPDGWALCDDKTTGVPDLRGRFILGANTATNNNTGYSKNEMNATGGSETHTLTVEEIPSHDHGFSAGGGTGGNNGPRDGYGGTNGFYQVTFKTGGGKPHNNMPPYYALAYIMKL